MNKLIISVLVLLLAGCSSQQKTVKYSDPMANEPFIIYKTKADYHQLVPVILNEDKTVVISYPAPSDLKTAHGLRLPTKLANGYLLDNKGIGKHVAFTSYTYEAYANRDKVPTVEQLMKNIVDKDPLLELYDCKSFINIKHDLKQVNKLVKNNLRSCVKLK